MKEAERRKKKRNKRNKGKENDNKDERSPLPVYAVIVLRRGGSGLRLTISQCYNYED